MFPVENRYSGILSGEGYIGIRALVEFFCLHLKYPTESHLKATKRILRYLKGTHDVGLWYPKGPNFELIGYSDSDYGGCKIDRMSTSGTCQLLGRSLVSWSSKKQNSVALSTAEAEYIAVGSCCAQILWMKATLKDFGINFKQVPLLCDNESAVKLTNNLVQHSRTKHIDVRHHFIRDHQQKGDICIESIGTDDQVADIHQATWWEEVLQAKEWIEHTWLLKYVLTLPHYMTCLSFEQSKVKLFDMSFILCWTCLVHLVIPYLS